jgi:hypothetical protein
LFEFCLFYALLRCTSGCFDFTSFGFCYQLLAAFFLFVVAAVYLFFNLDFPFQHLSSISIRFADATEQFHLNFALAGVCLCSSTLSSSLVNDFIV